MIYTLARVAETAQSTKGAIQGPDGTLICECLELGTTPLNGHVRIPPGNYRVRIRTMWASKFDAYLSTKIVGYRGVLQVLDVPGRTSIEIHAANQVKELEGCIAPGTHVEKLSDGNFGVRPGTSIPGLAALYAEILKDPANARLVVSDIMATSQTS